RRAGCPQSADWPQSPTPRSRHVPSACLSSEGFPLLARSEPHSILSLLRNRQTLDSKQFNPTKGIRTLGLTVPPSLLARADGDRVKSPVTSASGTKQIFQQ